jgi:hypothetical protein
MTPEQFLLHCRLYPQRNLFAVGTFERGITFYSQQVRALNLIYAMHEARRSNRRRFPAGTKVAVIGGGAFGLAAAAAASWVGYRVCLFERCQVLVPVQRGCDTRWLHPHFYNWPAFGSNDPQAHLPLLDWHAGTAGQVAEQIENAFNHCAEEVRRAQGRLTCITGATGVTVRRDRSMYEVKCRADEGAIPFQERFKAVVYGVGFGVEHDETARSYWRNDDLGQIDMARATKKDFFISGVGDGGLTDLFRLTLSNFRHERIFLELFFGLDDGIVRSLQKIIIRTNSKPHLREKEGWLFGQFQDIENDARTERVFKTLLANLKTRVRVDTRVVLNGKAVDFRGSLNLARTALKNAFLAYMLRRGGAFEYKGGMFRREATGTTLDGKPFCVPENVIRRHGTDRSENLVGQLEFDAGAIGRLRPKHGVNTGKPLYPLDWWAKNRASDEEHGTSLELLSRTTAALSTMFLTTLANILQATTITDDGDARLEDETQETLRFRLTLHRLIEFDAQEHFQQLTPYAGLNVIKGAQGGQGRLFPISRGTIGMTCQTGKPIGVRRETERQWMKVWRLMHFGDLKARPIQRHVASILACPFFSAGDGNETRVCMVLFADSSSANFFNDPVLRTIYAACKGFVSNLEEMRRTNFVTEVTEQYAGYRVQNLRRLQKIERELEQLNVQFDNAHFSDYRADLTFQTLTSLNLTFTSSLMAPTAERLK